ncbi:MAG: DNA polymerase I [Chlamydiae bacterium]|nr:DNA polymerase I [Chlamydiota bacterium]
MKNLFVIDAVGYLFRSYFAIKKMTSPEGKSTNALYGFIRSIQKLMKDFSPSHMVAVFDGPGNKNSRTAIYQDYKAHREGMPEDLIYQLAWAHQFCEYAGIPMLSVPGVEADDTMGSIAKWAEKNGSKVFLCSSDKDLCQLVNDHVVLLQTFKDNLIVDSQKVEEIYGVLPSQIIDLLAIMGDTSDNIPGVSGMGPKTAQKLLEEHGSLHNLLLHPEKIKNGSWQKKLIEQKENALISQKLATLQLDVPFPQDCSFFCLKDGNREKLKEFYQGFHFLTLLKEMEPVRGPSTTKYTILDDEESLKKQIKKWEKASLLCIDTETDKLCPMTADLVGIGLAENEEEIFYIPCQSKLGKENVLNLLRPLLESKLWIGHNIKYDMHVLMNQKIQIQPGFDTLIASYLLHSDRNQHNLDQLSLEFFDKVKIPITDLIGSGKKEISMLDVEIEKVAAYCAEDVEYTLKLKNLFSEKLKERGLSDLFYTIEMPLITTLFMMERHGIYLNEEKLLVMAKDFGAKLHEVEEKIYMMAGERFNINSPKQLSHILFTKLAIPKGKTASTSADVLASLQANHPIAEKILEYRAMEKLRSTYIEALPKQINVQTKRIHCTFNQSGTATGRLSSNNPNLQNIPVRTDNGRKIREAFEPAKGSLFLSADYSQIELRILAHLSNDPTLIDAFSRKVDIHTDTAAKIFHVNIDQVTKEMRNQAKAVNFGIIYGQGSYGLSQTIGIEVKEAAKFIEAYFRHYPKVKEFIETCQKEAEEKGYTSTIMHRQRLVPDIHSKNAMIRQAALRISVNAPIQGSQSDLMKLAMLRIDQKLLENQLSSFMVLQIHDEVILECKEEEIEICKKIVRECMESVATLQVPLEVDISIGKNWGEC